MLGYGDVGSGRQRMLVQLEERLVVRIVVPVVVETPAMADMAQHALFLRLITPEANDAAFVLEAFPGLRIDVIVFRQRSNELISVSSASFRKLFRTGEGEAYF